METEEKKSANESERLKHHRHINIMHEIESFLDKQATSRQRIVDDTPNPLEILRPYLPSKDKKI